MNVVWSAADHVDLSQQDTQLTVDVHRYNTRGTKHHELPCKEKHLNQKHNLGQVLRSIMCADHKLKCVLCCNKWLNFDVSVLTEVLSLNIQSLCSLSDLSPGHTWFFFWENAGIRERLTSSLTCLSSVFFPCLAVVITHWVSCYVLRLHKGLIFTLQCKTGTFYNLIFV